MGRVYHLGEDVLCGRTLLLILQVSFQGGHDFSVAVVGNDEGATTSGGTGMAGMRNKFGIIGNGFSTGRTAIGEKIVPLQVLFLSITHGNIIPHIPLSSYPQVIHRYPLEKKYDMLHTGK